MTGWDDLEGAFSHHLDLAALQRMRERRVDEYYWDELADEARRIGDDEAAEAIAVFLRRHHYGLRRRRVLDSLRTRLRKLRESLR